MKLKFFILLLLILLIFNSSLLIGTVRYVSKTGTSTPPYTNWTDAADSIQKCINICVDGDTVYVANGIYKENLVINTAISLVGSSMDSTVIDGTGMGDMTIIINRNTLIENFNIYGKVNGVGYGIYSVSNLPTVSISNCFISQTGRGIAVVGLNAHNIIMNNLRSGIINSANPNSNNYIADCIMNLSSENSNGINLSGPNYANYHINNNIILYTGSIFDNPREGISIGAPRKVYINNNLISGFRDNIWTDDPMDTILIKNNILINQNSFSSITGSISGNNDIIVANNLILSKNKQAINGDLIVKSDYNLFWQNQINLQGVAMGDSDIVGDPMFVKDTIPTVNGNYDFHLQAYSPAIDKGDPNILDLDRTRSDVGLYGGPLGETYTYQDLAPLAPRNLSAVVDSNNVTVKWNRNTEADTAYYKVYRDTVSGFTIDSTKLISSQTDTFFVNLPPYNSSKYVYTITCVDNQGNESLSSTEIVVDITSMTDDEYPMTISDYILYQNYPNPFNPSTKIGYQLKERAYVKLMVYDIKGELVNVLVNKEQNTGYYEADFNFNGQMSNVKGNLASGIYLYRIEVIGEGNIPVYTEMKKMLMIK